MYHKYEAQGRMSLFAAARGDKTAMRPFVIILCPLSYFCQYYGRYATMTLGGYFVRVGLCEIATLLHPLSFNASDELNSLKYDVLPIFRLRNLNSLSSLAIIT